MVTLATSAHWLHDVKRGLLTLIGIIVIIYLAMILVSFSPNDPSWSHINTEVTSYANMGGAQGAWLSDLLLTFIGRASWLLPLYIVYEVILLWWERRGIFNALRVIGYVFLLFGLSAFLSTQATFGQEIITADNSLSISRSLADNMLANGGIIGYELATRLQLLLTQLWTWLFLGLFLLATATLAFDIRWKSLFLNLTSLNWLGSGLASEIQDEDDIEELDDAIIDAESDDESEHEHEGNNQHTTTDKHTVIDLFSQPSKKPQPTMLAKSIAKHHNEATANTKINTKMATNESLNELHDFLRQSGLASQETDTVEADAQKQVDTLERKATGSSTNQAPATHTEVATSVTPATNKSTSSTYPFGIKSDKMAGNTATIKEKVEPTFDWNNPQTVEELLSDNSPAQSSVTAVAPSASTTQPEVTAPTSAVAPTSSADEYDLNFDYSTESDIFSTMAKSVASIQTDNITAQPPANNDYEPHHQSAQFAEVDELEIESEQHTTTQADDSHEIGNTDNSITDNNSIDNINKVNDMLDNDNHATDYDAHSGYVADDGIDSVDHEANSYNYHEHLIAEEKTDDYLEPPYNQTQHTPKYSSPTQLAHEESFIENASDNQSDTPAIDLTDSIDSTDLTASMSPDTTVESKVTQPVEQPPTEGFITPTKDDDPFSNQSPLSHKDSRARHNHSELNKADHDLLNPTDIDDNQQAVSDSDIYSNVYNDTYNNADDNTYTHADSNTKTNIDRNIDNNIDDKAYHNDNNIESDNIYVNTDDSSHSDNGDSSDNSSNWQRESLEQPVTDSLSIQEIHSRQGSQGSQSNQNNQLLDNQSIDIEQQFDSSSNLPDNSNATLPDIHDDEAFAGKSRAFQTAKHRKNLSPIPSLDILDKPDPNRRPSYTRFELGQLSELLEIKLQDFNVKAEVVNAIPGPVVTRFEVELAPGVKASKVVNISRDLARSLSMASLRVVEVIPGKPYIGIEVPNKKREMVRLIELLDTDKYRDPNGQISMAMGKDIGGKPIITDLAKAPHMLVAGTTGSGKSVLVNSMLLSMLLKYKPDELRLILIDPKQLELANYNDIPHLLTPVVTDMTEAAGALSWCVAEMERRYQLMSLLRVRKLKEFNKKVLEAEQQGKPIIDPLWRPNDSVSIDKAPKLKPLPMIVIVADEFADMIMQVGKQAEELITRLAQKSRASGIHLMLATQRPSVDVITGLIKANVPVRAALRVNSKVDSRTILDAGGAEDMLGNGDMLFLGPGQIEPDRVHGAFVSDEEVNRVCEAWRERGAPDYIDNFAENFQLSSSDSGSGTTGGTSGEDDAFYNEAVAFILETRKVSASSIQRKFSIGYNRAARIVDSMEQAGIVSPMIKGKREILV